jgi:hypothetical protein
MLVLQETMRVTLQLRCQFEENSDSVENGLGLGQFLSDGTVVLSAAADIFDIQPNRRPVVIGECQQQNPCFGSGCKSAMLQPGVLLAANASRKFSSARSHPLKLFLALPIAPQLRLHRDVSSESVHRDDVVTFLDFETTTS